MSEVIARTNSEVPTKWVFVSVNTIAASVKNAIVGGPFGSDLVSKDYVSDGVPVIRGQNMGEHWLQEPYVFVTEEKAKALEANWARPGDVVFTQRGTLGQVSLVPHQKYAHYLVSQSQMKVSLDDSLVDSRYFHYWFSSSQGQAAILQSAIQTGVPHINLGILRSLPLLLPPLAEQARIASSLSAVDALISSLDKLITKKRDIQQATMQQLLTGQRRLPGFSGEWAVKRLGDHLSFLRNGTNSRAELSTEGDVHYLHYGDIHGSRHLLLNPSKTSMPCLPRDKAKRLDRLESGDLVFADASEDLDGVGKSVEVQLPEGMELVSGLHTIAARFDKKIITDGFKAYLQFIPAFRLQLRQLAAGTKVYATNRAHIASAELRIPAIDEQTAIATILSDMDTELAALEARREKTRQLKQGMMQELLTGKTRLL